MSSHREAPEISKDPVADSSDLYAFVDPNHPDSVTILANYVPLQDPSGGPNFFEFGDDVLYEIHISNKGRAKADVTYGFRFTTHVNNPNTFLYNTGQVNQLDSSSLNRYQTYTLTRTASGKSSRTLVKNARVAPANVGPRSMPDYGSIASSAIRSLPSGGQVFAGPRADGFYVDLGATFDLLTLRPFQNLHRFATPAQPSVNTLAGLNVHTLALRIPIDELTSDGSVPTKVDDEESVIGVWTSASRQRARVLDDDARRDRSYGSWQQVSRLGNPLFNEVLVPMVQKDGWNRSQPRHDATYAKGVTKPEIAGLLPFLYPNVFPKLAAYTKDRADLAAILLTGIPKGVVPGLNTFTGTTQADMLRLNVAIKPSSKPSPLGVLGGVLAAFPNGRRPIDDVVTIELQAIAGATIPLVDPGYTPDGAATLVGDKLATPSFMSSFPFLATPHDGYSAHTAAS